MIVFALVAAALFTFLLGTANVLFALQLGNTIHEHVFWIAVALASACWTIAGVGVLGNQLAGRRWARAGAAGVVLSLALSYDIMAAYGLSRLEQSARQTQLLAHTTQVEAVAADLGLAEAALSAMPIVSEAEARAATAVVTVTAEQCAEVTGPNRYSRRTADRLRAACVVRSEALGLSAQVEARKAHEATVAALRRDLSVLQRARPAPDPRTELLPVWAVAWAPVVLITGGGLFAGFALGTPTRPGRKEIARSPETPKPEPIEADPQALSVVGDLPEPLQVTAERLLTIAKTETPAGLKRDAAGYIRGTQRLIADAIGEPVIKTHKALKHMAGCGLIDLDAGRAGTGFRLVQA